MDAASVVTPTSFVAAPNEEQQLDLFDNSSESRFNELTGSDLPAARKQETSEIPGVPTAAAATAASTLIASEEGLAVRAEEPRQQMQAIAEKRATNQQPHMEPLVVLQPAAAVELQGVVVANLKGGNKAAARRAMGSISQEGGLEPRAGSSAGSSVKGVAAANAPSTASLSTQVRVTLPLKRSSRTLKSKIYYVLQALPHIGFETKVCFEAQHELAKSRSSRFRPQLSSARSPDTRVQGTLQLVPSHGPPHPNPPFTSIHFIYSSDHFRMAANKTATGYCIVFYFSVLIQV